MVLSVNSESRRFFRSVSLEADFLEVYLLDNYRVTEQVRRLLLRFQNSLSATGTERAYTLTGPYGSGKSSFALFLAHLLAKWDWDNGKAWRILRTQALHVAERLYSTSRQGFIPIALTLTSDSLRKQILKGIKACYERLGFADRVVSILEQDERDNQFILKTLSDLVDFGMQNGYSGVVLLLDELGKTLEYSAKQFGNDPYDDVYLLQELAEAACRSGSKPFIIIGILHQAFDSYTERLLSATARKEWQKVQGRFSDIPFLEPPSEQIRLAVSALQQLNLTTPPEQSDLLRDLARKLLDQHQSLVSSSDLDRRVQADTVNDYLPAGMSGDEFIELATNAYPLHPLSLLSLPFLFRRFAQNERSLFTYLYSFEPFSLQSFIGTKNELVCLHDLFDYFTANVVFGALQKGAAKRWIEVLNVIDASPRLSKIEVLILKTIGLLNILNESSNLRPKKDLITISLYDQEKSLVEQSLRSLVDSRIITYRRFNDTYKVWEGSDIDIEAKFEEAHRRIDRVSIAEVANRYIPPRPLVARKHSYEKGSLRFFHVRYVDSLLEADDVVQSVVKQNRSITERTPFDTWAVAKASFDGMLLFCLADTRETRQAFVEWAQSDHVRQQKSSIIAISLQPRELQELARELEAANTIWKITPELRDDRVARIELAERTALIEQSLKLQLERLFQSSNTYLQWFHQGKQQDIRSVRQLTSFLSKVMDEVYTYSPYIHNELINRRVLSSSAAAARKNLVEAMLLRGHLPKLGIDGYPPERSVYEAFLLKSGIHRQNTDGTWHFGSPLQDDPCRLLPAWEYLERAIFGSANEPVPISSLYHTLTAPPYGLLEGILPILLMAFVLAHPNEVSLYRDEMPILDLQVPAVEVLLRRPELYQVCGFRIRGQRSLLVRYLAQRLGCEPTALEVVRLLVRIVRAFPDWAWCTKDLPPHVLRVREAFQQMRSPESLLFFELPKALGMEPFEDAGGDSQLLQLDNELFDAKVENFRARLKATLEEWSGFYPQQLQWARDCILEKCGFPLSEEGWQLLIMKANALQEKPVNPSLLPFLKRVSMDDGKNLEGIISLLAEKPMKSWSDNERSRFLLQLEQTGRLFQESVGLYGILTPEEERLSRSLAERFRAILPEGLKEHVLRAACMQLLQEQPKG